MKTLLLPIFFAALVMASSAWAQTTQTEIQADLLQTQIIAELKAKNYAKADALFRQYDALGVDMPPPLQLQRALTHFHLKKYWEAEKLLLVYLQRAQRGSDEYRQALSMLAEVKPLAAPARAEAARAAVIKREQEAKARAREATRSLFRAVYELDFERAEAALRAGADVNAKRGKYGITPLHSAAGCTWDRDECYHLASLLLSHGAHVNAKDKDGETPLFFAVYFSDWGKNDTSMVELLLRAGADANVKNNNGVTILEQAKGRPRAVKKLLREYGATK